MDKKYIIASSFVAFAVLLTGVLATNAAFRGEEDRGMGFGLDPEKKAEMQEKRAEMKEQMEEKRAEMDEVMSSGDYNTWKAYIEAKQAERFNILDVINEGNFDKLVEMHELKQAGDHEGAKAIAEELGIPKGKGMGHKMGMHRGMKKFGKMHQEQN